MRASFAIILLLCGLVSACCESEKLPLGSVLMSQELVKTLAETCRNSNFSSEQEMLVISIQDYLKELHLKPGEDRQDCRLRRDERCRITDVICASRQTVPRAPAHCRAMLDGPPVEDRAYDLPCTGGCGGGQRLPKYGWQDFDNYSLTELDKIVLDTGSADRSQALGKVVAYVERVWQQKRQAPDFDENTLGNRPKLRAPGAPCPRSIRYERLPQNGK